MGTDSYQLAKIFNQQFQFSLALISNAQQSSFALLLLPLTAGAYQYKVQGGPGRYVLHTYIELSYHVT